MATERGKGALGEHQRSWLGDDKGCFVAFSFMHLICTSSFINICERWNCFGLGIWFGRSGVDLFNSKILFL